MAWPGTVPLHSPETLGAIQLLRHVAAKIAGDFAGVGIVFYETVTGLPHLPLEVGGNEHFELPVNGLDAICDVLVRTARRSSQWHDGFHFVHADSVSLTHLCQFIAPALPEPSAAPPRARGARHMTALLASQAQGVRAIGLLTRDRVASVYEAGRLTLTETL